MNALPAFTTLGAGPTLLMLHDSLGGHLTFAPQVESFAGAGYRAMAWDMPGYGRSAPLDPYNFKNLANSCIALIEGLRSGPLVLIGHGMGGMVAQEVVARRPDLVRRLVLCATLARGFEASGGTEGEPAAELAEGQTLSQLAEIYLPRLVGPGALPEGVMLAHHAMGQVNPSAYRRAVAEASFFNREDALTRIHVPTLLVAGEFDRAAPPELMKRMVDRIGPSSTLAVLRGVGHLPQLEAPDDFDSAVLNFLAIPHTLH
ncbi:alpha/beta fold hydrolase [Curvibacter sp. HBC61]|uniref:Alpha/beta fold hydrolase n=1 Tax=Curvibacter cyanobacteriorum TaxID=3026422 RepID=A0ABT5N1W6_9BURK|nr:alpha/beta fold hydrolase [Curvibacter sp. HBC61]MDD0840288.1 alpha/beta fold hydrolase [Curvibacter sp. HBC61]